MFGHWRKQTRKEVDIKGRGGKKNERRKEEEQGGERRRRKEEEGRGGRRRIVSHIKEKEILYLSSRAVDVPVRIHAVTLGPFAPQRLIDASGARVLEERQTSKGIAMKMRRNSERSQ